jgi:hypothetical protein
MIRAKLTRWLLVPTLRGWPALLCGIVAIGLPTAVRAEVNGIVTGCEFTPYLPFILICAILLRWWQAAAAALLSVAILGGLFEASPSLLPCFISAAGIFLGASAMMIAAALLVRHVIVAIQDRGADEAAGGIVFSLEQGEVWASWYGQGPPMRLGSQRKVSEMMKDFLAQEELGHRLARR